MVGLSCYIIDCSESDQEEGYFREQLSFMYERVGNNGPCLVGLCRGSGYLGWQRQKIAEMECTRVDRYEAADGRFVGAPNVK